MRLTPTVVIAVHRHASDPTIRRYEAWYEAVYRESSHCTMASPTHAPTLYTHAPNMLPHMCPPLMIAASYDINIYLIYIHHHPKGPSLASPHGRPEFK